MYSLGWLWCFSVTVLLRAMRLGCPISAVWLCYLGWAGGYCTALWLERYIVMVWAITIFFSGTTILRIRFSVNYAITIRVRSL